MYSARNDGETQYVREWNQDLDEKILKLQEIVHDLNYPSSSH